jgi:DNA invertase Pin-like site-specific DNA recombinase
MKSNAAVAYYRVSTEAQGHSRLGLEAQQAAVARYCEAAGLSLVATYEEVESGKRNDRPVLAEAIARARRAKATLVLATLDRLGRKVSKISTLLDDARVPFVCCDAPNDSKFVLHIRASVAEEEGRKISERTSKALQALKARGVKLGTPANLTREAGLKGAATMKARAAAENRTLALEVRELRAKGLSLRAIAEETGASRMTVCRLLKAEAADRRDRPLEPGTH